MNTCLVHRKSFWIRKLSQFIQRKKEFDKWCKENAESYTSIFNQDKKSLSADISDLREHFKWVTELEDFFTIHSN